MIDQYDELITLCPQLGDIPFRYCRTVNEDLPCRRVIVCWELRFEIAGFLNDHYLYEEVQRVLSPPTKSRVETILELIENARKAGEKEV